MSYVWFYFVFSWLRCEKLLFVLLIFVVLLTMSLFKQSFHSVFFSEVLSLKAKQLFSMLTVLSVQHGS
jgi:hypothetical protein